MNKPFPTSLLSKALVFIGTSVFVGSSAIAAVAIDQQPIFATKPVPANVSIVGSFEYPTMVTRAYNKGVPGDDVGENTYSENGQYIGYFDNKKCYEYHYDKNDEENRYFNPVNKNGPLCPGEKQWSGNFLNWATMQTIDIFRHVLTGGYRSRDKENETLLEKGVQNGQGSNNNFPLGKITILNKIFNKNIIKNAVPVGGVWTKFSSRIGQKGVHFGNKMRFSDIGRLQDWAFGEKSVVVYDGKQITGFFDGAKTFELSVRVKVCVAGLLEDNCQKQPNGNYKPVGLIQQYAEQEGIPRMRFNAFGYLNDPNDAPRPGFLDGLLGTLTGGLIGTIPNEAKYNRFGGVMHARMKYVGLNQANEFNIASSNDNAEWDAYGIFIDNPDDEDAAATLNGVPYSGVVNYINRSGLIVPGTQFKQYDNVSELYYTAYRYLKGLDNIPEYSSLNLPSKSKVNKEQLVGGLPVITDWKKDDHDPIQFTCQKNFIIGIGDSNTHYDRSIETKDDPVFQNNRFRELRQNMHAREKSDNLNFKDRYENNGNSDYIAVLAYDANTTDIRPNMAGKQTVQTHWVDILEKEGWSLITDKSLKKSSENPYWMTAKYGGFRVPEAFNPTEHPASTTALDDSLWRNFTNKLSTGDKHPNNFYPVNDPQELINSLNRVFQSIQLDQSGADSSIAISSAQTDDELMAYQTRYVSGSWTGNLYGYKFDTETKAPKAAPEWDAESQLPNWKDRNVYTNISGLKKFISNGTNFADLTQEQVNYLLGDRSKEGSEFRQRDAVLGDIINSQPVYVGRPQVDAFSTRNFPEQESYSKWATSHADRKPTVYVGGNDGMLHGFDAKTGKETFAFIPATVIENGLKRLTDKNYLHRYSVDGKITVADTYINGSWQTILVGTLGAGGVSDDRQSTHNAIFALNITDPENISLLWEKTSNDIPELGINLGQPVIIQNEKKQWKVVLGNGPNSQKDTASLISLDLTGNTQAYELSSVTNNGLSSLRTWDSTGDGLTDTLYGGDLQGNVWKISNLTGPPKITKLFTAVDTDGLVQPITTTPLVGVSPYDRTTWLFFGTGQYLSTADVVNDQLQTWYGIKDNGVKALKRSDLRERLIEAEITNQKTAVIERIIEKGTLAEMVGKQGWFIDLYRIVDDKKEKYGERMVVENQFQGRTLIGVTRVPNANDPCAPFGSGMIMAINPFTGARLDSSFFDINQDGLVSNKDLVTIDGKKVPVSGLSIQTGSSMPTFLGNKMLSSDTQGPTSSTANIDRSILLQPSWRELINREN